MGMRCPCTSSEKLGRIPLDGVLECGNGLRVLAGVLRGPAQIVGIGRGIMEIKAHRGANGREGFGWPSGGIEPLCEDKIRFKERKKGPENSVTGA